MYDIIRYLMSYLQKVVSVYVGYYQVRYFVLAYMLTVMEYLCHK
jgi:high-affinity nickel permease